MLNRNQLIFADRQAERRAGHGPAWPIILLVLAGLSYNAVLAFINARGLTLNRPTVVTTEILILIGVAIALLGFGARRIDKAPAYFFAFFLANALAVSLLDGAVFIEMARNAAIIALFFMLGVRLQPTALARCFLLAAGITFLVLLIEIISVEAYANIFSPASYFAQTRGYTPSEFDESGLFGNALGWADRFSLLAIIDHRASSIFLEQVSLANFGVVLTIFLCCRWQHVSKAIKIALIPLIALIVVTTASRTAFGLVLAAPLAYWLAPKLNRFSTLAVMPIALAGALLITNSNPATGEDNLEGRLGYTIRNLGELDLSSIAGANALEAATYADSGYMYVIVGSSILGLLVLWLFVSLIVSGRSDEMKRCSMLLSLYVFSNLLVSGTSIFSIKTAALLWLLVGFIRAQEQQGTGIAVGREAAPDRSPMAPVRPKVVTATRTSTAR